MKPKRIIRVITSKFNIIYEYYSTIRDIGRDDNDIREYEYGYQKQKRDKFNIITRILKILEKGI